MNSINYFIAGTDTGIGKTYVSVQILEYFNNLGLRTLGIKPLASGCNNVQGILCNEDALRLQEASSVKLDYDRINPFRFEQPIAPHIAATQNNQRLSVSLLKTFCADALNHPADVRIIEGVGGWLVPLNTNETMADFVNEMQFPVILVVGIRLGCLNHALLTLSVMRKQSIKVVGWIANCIDPMMLYCEENIQTLKTFVNAPCLGVIQYQQKLNFVKFLQEFRLEKSY